MTTAQVLFSVALGLIALIIVSFAVYVVSTTTWGDRWASKTNRNKSHGTSETK